MVQDELGQIEEKIKVVKEQISEIDLEIEDLAGCQTEKSVRSKADLEDEKVSFQQQLLVLEESWISLNYDV